MFNIFIKSVYAWFMFIYRLDILLDSLSPAEIIKYVVQVCVSYNVPIPLTVVAQLLSIRLHLIICHGVHILQALSVKLRV